MAFFRIRVRLKFTDWTESFESCSALLHPRKRRTRAAVSTGGTGAAPGGVASKNGQGHMRVQREVISYSPRCLCVYVSPLVSPLKWQFRSIELRNYFDTCGVGSKRSRPAAKKAPALPERCTTGAKSHIQSFNLRVSGKTSPLSKLVRGLTVAVDGEHHNKEGLWL